MPAYPTAPQPSNDPENIGTPEPFDGAKYVDALEDVAYYLRKAQAADFEDDREDAMRDALLAVQDVSGRPEEYVTFRAFVGDQWFHVCEALKGSYRDMRVRMLRVPGMAKYYEQGEAKHLEEALKAVGLEHEIERQASLAAAIVARMQEQLRGAEDILRREA